MKYTKKQIEETHVRLKQELEGFAQGAELPGALQTQKLMAILPEQTGRKNTVQVELRHIAYAIAAVAVLLLSIALAYPSSRALLGGMVTGEKKTSGNTGILQEADPSLEPGAGSTKERLKQTQSQTETQTTEGGAKTVQLDARIERANSYMHIDAVFKKLRETYAADEKMLYASRSPGSVPPTAAAAPQENKSIEDAAGNDRSSAIGKTNTQVANVDEADILKNDGRYLYLAHNNENKYDDQGNYKAVQPSTVTIVALQSGGAMEKKTVITITPQDREKGERITGLFLWNGKLVVLTQQYADTFATGYSENELSSRLCGVRDIAQKTLVRVYALGDVKNPKLEATWSQDGSYLSARLTGDKLCVVTDYSVSLAQDAEKDAIYPKTGVNGKEERIEASCLYVPKTEPEANYLVVTTASLAQTGNKPKRAAVLGCGDTVYCTGEMLYAARSVYKDAGEVTEIYQFSIGGTPEFVASGEVKGSMLNQFSMDAYKGYLRVVTTQSTWDEKSGQRKTDNALYVLNARLKQEGSVHNLAPGETVQSVRFAGDTAYVVTFLQTDPLFVIDCSDPQKPVVKGELKIPGFSSYLHPVTKDLVIGIGKPGNDSGTTEGIKIALFDVSDPKKPLEVDQITVGKGSNYCDTPAWSEHKAFFYYTEKVLFGFPVCINEQWRIDTFRVDIAAKKLLRDKVYPSDVYDTASPDGSRRATYVHETLYGWFGDTLLSFSMQSGARLAELEV